MIFVGIDPGTHTGYAVWDSKSKQLLELATVPIHQALKRVEALKEGGGMLCVVFEDARKSNRCRSSTGRLQGAGSVKRDCSIWEDFCEDMGISYRAIPPRRGFTKMTEEYFKAVTGWTKRTSNHARDAAMLVFGLYM